MNALVPIGDRLDPLIRRLASDQPGEVLACVVAMKRQLAKVGLDFNDLAARLTAPAVTYHPELDARCGGVRIREAGYRATYVEILTRSGTTGKLVLRATSRPPAGVRSSPPRGGVIRGGDICLGTAARNP